MLTTTETLQPGDPAPRSHAQTSSTNSSSSNGSSGLGVGLYVFLLIGGAVAYGAYQYLNAAAANESQ
jgi:hypothetical protein